jgi:hypothetical protein
MYIHFQPTVGFGQNFFVQAEMPWSQFQASTSVGISVPSPLRAHSGRMINDWANAATLVSPKTGDANSTLAFSICGHTRRLRTPGALHTQADFNGMKDKIAAGAEP